MSERETCNTCKHLVADPQNLQETLCLRMPPTAHPILAMDTRLNKPVLTAVAAIFPPRKRTDPACGEHSFKLHA